MKAFFEDLGKRIGEATETVSNKAGDAVEIQKLKGQIRTLERGNDADLIDLGRTIYEKFKAGESVSEEEAGLCEAIQSREESIAEYQAKIVEVRGAFHCGECGKIIAKGMAYCPYCGMKVPEDQQAEPIDYAEVVDNVVDTVKGAAGKAAEKAAEAVGNVIDKVKDTAEDVVDVAAEEVEDAVDVAAEKAEEVKETVAETAEEVVEEVKETVEEVKEDVADAAEEEAEDVADAAEEAVEEVKEAE